MFESKLETNKFILVKIMMPPKNIEVQVPRHWKINKLKCLIIKKIPLLKFDDFQLLCPQKGQILNGQLPLSKYAQRILKLGVIQKHQKEFGKYYSQSVKKLLYSVYSNSVQQQGTSFMLKMPILNKNFQKAHLIYLGYSKEQVNAAGQQREQNANEQQQQDNQFRFLNVLWILSIPFLLQLLTTYLSWEKTLVLLIAIFLYLFMHFHVRRNADIRQQRQPEPVAPNQQERQPRNNPNNQQIQSMKQQKQSNSLQEKQEQKKNQSNQPQKKQTNNVGAVFLHIIFFLVEASYCFACSLFPNWTVDVHLAANRQYLTRMQNAILKLNPQYQFKQK